MKVSRMKALISISLVFLSIPLYEYAIHFNGSLSSARAQKLDTTLSFTLSPNSVNSRETVVLSGSLTDIYGDPIYPAQVEVEYSRNGGTTWHYIWTLDTNEYGEFSKIFPAPAPSEYLARASYPGNATYNPSSHNETLIVREPKWIYFNFVPNPATPSPSVTLNGVLVDDSSNSIGYATVKVEYSTNHETTWKHIWTLTTDQHGIFSRTFAAPGTGAYLVRITYADDSTHIPISNNAYLGVLSTILGEGTESFIFFNFIPNPATSGTRVALRGILLDEFSQPTASADVTVEYSTDHGASWRFIWTLTTNQYGIFSKSFTAPARRAYLVRVNYGGSSITTYLRTRDIEIVSVAYDPDIKSYPNKSESPYGPDVNPTYNLVEKALVYLNPENPDNPLSNIIQGGDTVVLKPNLVGTSGFAREGCTRTPILRPLVDFAVQAGASKVIIAEGSAYPYPDSKVFGPDYSNITGLVQALQSMYPGVVITYKDLNLDDFTWVDLGEDSTFYGVYTPQQLYSKDNIRMDEDSYYYAQDCNGYNPKGYRPGLYAIANTVFQADVFINVPKMKVHWITGVTLSLKNLIGITVSSTGNTTHEESIKDVPHWNNSGPKPVYDEVLSRQDSFANDVVWRVMADLNKIVLYANENGVLQPVKQRRYLSVVDAIIGMEGPTVYSPPGVPRPTGAIIAGQNPVAVDAVCSRVMGFNYTLLNSLVNMEKISDHPIGKADPTAICVVGASLNGQTFGEPYVPHLDYEDPQIAPYRIRLQYFDPPEAEVIETYPETPREGVETKVVVHTQNIELVAAGWLRYSLGDAEPMITKMVPSEETMIGNLGLLEGGTSVLCDVCLQDYFFNTGWSDRISIFVGLLDVFSVFWDEVECQATAMRARGLFHPLIFLHHPCIFVIDDVSVCSS